MEADFSGYATKANLKCSDGRTIIPDAFKHMDGKKVPLVWQHNRNDPKNVLGHALLEAREDGVYTYAFFNDSESAKQAATLVQHGDITAMSIYANRLVEKAKTVMHGVIREVSLVLSGANPGALIDNVRLAHSDGEVELLDEEAVIYTGLSLEHENPTDDETDEPDEEDVEHAEEDEETIQDVVDSMSDKQRDVMFHMVEKALEIKEARHSDEEVEESEDADLEDSDATHSETENPEGNEMTHNVFEQDGTKNQGPTLSHEDALSIFENAKRMGSLTEAVEAHALKHGIEDIDIMFPDAKSVTATPDFDKRRTEWVAGVINGTRHTPFSRIKSLTANLTLPEARAKGYVKGNVKKEEFFKVAKRVTTPQTIYKKQKLDRDDILDITDFDVVAWLKGEMRLMLEEELARAILIGDGRSAEDDDKIKEEHIRPIATDDDLFVTYLYVNLDDADSSPEELVDALTLQRRHYRGSGNPTLYTSELILSRLLMVKDTLGRRIYTNVSDLAAVLRVSNIIAVEVMDEPSVDVAAIMVNLQDYTVGADKGGEVSLFDDFDIDYNQYKYLIETRASGALTKAKSALVVKKVSGAATLVTPEAPTWDAENHSVTVATTTGVTYKNKLTNATLTTASPVVLTEGEELTVIATPASSSYYLSSSTEDEWLYDYEDGQVGGAF